MSIVICDEEADVAAYVKTYREKNGEGTLRGPIGRCNDCIHLGDVKREKSAPDVVKYDDNAPDPRFAPKEGKADWDTMYLCKVGQDGKEYGHYRYRYRRCDLYKAKVEEEK